VRAAPSGLKVVNHGCKKQASGRVQDQSKTEHKDNIGHDTGKGIIAWDRSPRTHPQEIIAWDRSELQENQIMDKNEKKRKTTGTQ
jgi:hypothetical protein